MNTFEILFINDSLRYVLHLLPVTSTSLRGLLGIKGYGSKIELTKEIEFIKYNIFKYRKYGDDGIFCCKYVIGTLLSDEYFIATSLIFTFKNAGHVSFKTYFPYHPYNCSYQTFLCIIIDYHINDINFVCYISFNLLCERFLRE